MAIMYCMLKLESTGIGVFDLLGGIQDINSTSGVAKYRTSKNHRHTTVTKLYGPSNLLLKQFIARL